MVAAASQQEDMLPQLVRRAAQQDVATAQRVRLLCAIRVLLHRAVTMHNAGEHRATTSTALAQRLNRVYDDRMQRVAATYTPGNWTGD